MRDALLVASALFLAAGCKVGPDYSRPTTAPSDSYKELAGWKPAQPSDEAMRGSWWGIYGDAELSSLLERVQVQNQNLAQAAAQFRQARALVHAARAAYFPTATLGAFATRNRRSTGLTQGLSNPGTITPNYLLPFDVNWEADVWGKVRRDVEANIASAQASAADVETARLLYQTEVAQDYFLIRALDSQKELLDRTVVDYRKTVLLTQNRYDSGVASKIEVLQADTQLKSTLSQAIDLAVQRAQLEHAIAILIGEPPSTFSITSAALPRTVPVIPPGLPSELLERRPDIAAAERRVAAANARIGVAVAGFFPNISISASAGFESTDFSKWLTWPSRFWSVGPGISQTVFEGGLRSAQKEETVAAYEGAVAAYRQTVLTGFQEVEDNLSTLRILEEEAAAQEDAVKAAQQSVDIATNQYRAGTLNYLGVITAQAVALNNERTAVDILGRRLVASVLLIKALGGGWEAPTVAGR